MTRTTLAFAVLLGCGLGATAIASQTPAAVEPGSIVARSLDNDAANGSIAGVGVQTINDAAAAAVIGALRSQFPEYDVELKLGAIRSERASLRDIALDGAGQIRLEGSTTWLPIRFAALFDSDTQTVGSPSITITPTVFAASDLPVDVPRLDAAVQRRLGAEFASQAVAFELDGVSVVGGDARYTVVDGNGTADFGAEGQADVAVQGVYDRAARRWVKVDYELGSQQASVFERTVAVR